MNFSNLINQFAYDAKSPLIFNSGFFLFMFLLFTLVYYLLRNRNTARILFVTLFSYYFYYKSSGTHFFILAIVTLSDYLIAKAIESSRVQEFKGSRRASKLLVALSLCIDLGMLAYFKYTNFLIELINPLLYEPLSLTNILLPVGISFYTFQSLSYIIDVYRGNITPLNRFLDYAFYVSFFPQLVAGPIVRARDFIPQIHRPLAVSREMFSSGIFLIIAGLFKKAIISDYISLNFVDRIFDQPELYSGLENLLGIYGYSLQIYCDFSGYSDMAIGIALLLGFHFPKNFDSPYKSRSVSEFWRRWHISLSSWLRDYLYISLGGNRKGKIRTYINLMLTMLLGGLWHGASWNFVVWGGLHGLCLVVERILGIKKEKQQTGGFKTILRIIVTFHIVAFIWLFFRNSSFENSLLMIERIFTDFKPQLFTQVISGYSGVFTLIAIGYAIHLMPSSFTDRCKLSFARLAMPLQAIVMIILIWIVIQVKSSDIQPFIYFQF